MELILEDLRVALQSYHDPAVVVEPTSTGAHVYYPDGRRVVVQVFESRAGGLAVYEAAKAQREGTQ
jgi:hypothetical protein